MVEVRATWRERMSVVMAAAFVVAVAYLYWSA